ncbi:MAG: hypothetical protein K8S16_13410, partial [Bacteroidales bacterium]|nr:hypothetical protein [Bacteroidales bacterium]
AVNEKLKKSCEDAIVAFQKLKSEDYKDIQSKLEWCLGSYNYDNNPVGLHEYGSKSLDVLKGVKAKQPRKVSKKVIDGLKKAIEGFNQN